MNHPILTFNGGEVSPYLRHRIDFEKTPAACETLENFICLPYGADTKRPGLRHVAAVEDAGENSRLLPFIASTGDRYLLHFTADLLTILRTDGTVADSMAYLDGHTWTAGDWDNNLRAIQYVQLNDVAFIVHPAAAPMRLSRVADDNWTLEDIPFTSAPMLDENTDADVTIACLSDPAVSAWVNTHAYVIDDIVERSDTEWVCLKAHTSSGSNMPGITGSATYWKRRVFPAGHAVRLIATGAEFDTAINSTPSGVYYRLNMSREIDDMRTSLKAITANDMTLSPPIIVRGKYQVFTHGTWHGTFSVFRYQDPVNITGAETIRAYTANGDRNVADELQSDDLVAVCLRFEKNTSTAATGDQGAYIIPDSINVAGEVLVDTVDEINPENATGTTVSPCLSGWTFRHTPGAFSPTKGYPRAIALHDGRLAFAGTTSNPVSLWFSKTNDYLNFETGIEDDAAIFATLALSNSSPIRWIASQRRLFVGTAFGEWTVGSESTDSPLSPTNFIARQWAAYGSAPVSPLIANDAVFFAERKGTRLRELSYFADREGYDAADLTRLAEHLTRAGIAAMAWQQTREPGLWMVRRDGTLLHFAYARAERLAAWSRHTTTGGTFDNVAVLPSDDGDDEVFFIVTRGAVSYLERFPQHWMEAQEENSGWFHLDGVSGTGSGAAVTLPAYLKNTPVTNLNPTTLAVTTPTYSANPTITNGTPYHIGLPIPSVLTSLPIDFAGDSTMGRMKRLHRVSLSLFMSRGGNVINRTTPAPIPNTQPAETLRTGWEDTIPDAGHSTEIRLRLTHSDPFPFTLRAATLRFNVTEP